MLWFLGVRETVCMWILISLLISEFPDHTLVFLLLTVLTGSKILKVLTELQLKESLLREWERYRLIRDKRFRSVRPYLKSTTRPLSYVLVGRMKMPRSSTSQAQRLIL